MCTTRENVFSGIEIRKYNIGKCVFGCAVNKKVSLAEPDFRFLVRGLVLYTSIDTPR